jgi:hypothetical protein
MLKKIKTNVMNVQMGVSNIGETFLFPKPHSLEDSVKTKENSVTV